MRGKKDIIPAHNDPWKGEGRAGRGWRGWNAINLSWKCKGRMKDGVGGGRRCPGIKWLKMRWFPRSVMKGSPKCFGKGRTEISTRMPCPLTFDPAARWSRRHVSHTGSQAWHLRVPRFPLALEKTWAETKRFSSFSCLEQQGTDPADAVVMAKRSVCDERVGSQVKAQVGAGPWRLELSRVIWEEPSVTTLTGRTWSAEICLLSRDRVCYTSVSPSGRQGWCRCRLLHVKIQILAINISPGLHKIRVA